MQVRDFIAKHLAKDLADADIAFDEDAFVGDERTGLTDRVFDDRLRITKCLETELIFMYHVPIGRDSD